jgi:hypothetical protein
VWTFLGQLIHGSALALPPSFWRIQISGRS